MLEKGGNKKKQKTHKLRIYVCVCVRNLLHNILIEIIIRNK